MRAGSWLGLGTIFLGALGSPAVAQPGGTPTLQVGQLTTPLLFDGRLTEPAWFTADSIAALTQLEPREGGVPAGRTVVRVLATRDELIIGIRCDDPDASRITSFSVTRDAALSNEDHIRLVLDTFRDGRFGYVFAFNPGGARFDALITNQGEGANSDWDTVWEVKTSRDSLGWSAEMRLPVKSLIFRPGLESWGFNVQRRTQRTLQTDRWASPTRDIELGQTSRAGLLVGLPEFSVGMGLTVRPSGNAGVGTPAPAAPTDFDADASLDVTQRIGGNLLGSLTINTDFAEVDVDTRRTNFTRFPLFFPEKRSFFLEGSDIFDFGLGLGTDVIPFFSRRIGLREGREIPLRAGLKLNGRVGASNVGVLATRLGSVDGLAPAATVGAARIRQNVLRESSVGAIVTFGDPGGRPGGWTAGVDAVYQTSRFAGSKNFLLGVWGLLTDQADLDGAPGAYGVKIDYPNDLWDAAFTYKRVAAGFDPSLGFVPRQGVQLLSVGVNYSPRPGRWGIRQMFVENQLTLATDLNGQWESYRYFAAPVNWRMESGDRIEANVAPQGERLPEPFEVASEVLVPAGTYHFTRYRLEVELAAKRRLSGQLTWWFGKFYDGHLHQVVGRSSWNPWRLLTMELSGEYNRGHAGGKDFTTTLAATRARLNLSPDLQLTSYWQYDTDSRLLGTNTRLRWNYSRVGELFVVYNHNVRNRVGDRWQLDSNQLLAKLQYSLRY